MNRLRKAGDANAFITDPKPTIEMYDAVQAMQIIATYTKCNGDLYHDMVEEVSYDEWESSHFLVAACKGS